jgi:NodT family efflux transporter outer membrane factor (OMF) lipoprotein
MRRLLMSAYLSRLMKVAFLVWGVGSMFLLTSCLLGPDYQEPDLDIPKDWGDLNLAGDHFDLPVSIEGIPEVSWWQGFRNDELNKLIEQALERNHDVREASYRVMEGRALALAAGAGLYPEVDLEGSYTRIRRSENILAGPTDASPEGLGAKSFAPPGSSFDLWSAAMDLRWEIDMWGRIRRNMEAASSEAVAVEMDQRGVILALISDVGQAYFRLRELDEQIEIAEKNLALQKDSLSIISHRAQAGLVSDLDVKQAEVLAFQTAALIPDLQRQRAAQQHQLEVLTGHNPNTRRLAPRPLRKVLVQPIIPVGLPSELLQRRPDIVEMEETLKAANARIGEARAYFFPTIAITGTGGFRTSEFDQWFKWASRAFSIGPSITLPIFEGYTNVARLEIAESRYHQMLEQYHQTILNAFREVADLLVALQARGAQLASQHQEVQAAQEARELADIRYRKGLVTYLDVLDAERTVLQAELTLVQTERARLTDMVALFKAVGGGWTNEQQLEARSEGS